MGLCLLVPARGFVQGSSFHQNVYATSAFPVFLVGMVWAAYYAQIFSRNLKNALRGVEARADLAWRRQLFNTHFTMTLRVCYLFLPSVSTTQFKGLNCIRFTHSDDAYLKADTSIDCNSQARCEKTHPLSCGRWALCFEAVSRTVSKGAKSLGHSTNDFINDLRA